MAHTRLRRAAHAPVNFGYRDAYGLISLLVVVAELAHLSAHAQGSADDAARSGCRRGKRSSTDPISVDRYTTRGAVKPV